MISFLPLSQEESAVSLSWQQPWWIWLSEMNLSRFRGHLIKMHYFSTIDTGHGDTENGCFLKLGTIRKCYVCNTSGASTCKYREYVWSDCAGWDHIISPYSQAELIFWARKMVKSPRCLCISLFTFVKRYESMNLATADEKCDIHHYYTIQCLS